VGISSIAETTALSQFEKFRYSCGEGMLPWLQ
jgi:hypothetical protein